MKRFLSVLLVVVMLVSTMCVTTAFAAGDGTLTVSSATAQPGQDVTVTVKLSNNPGIAGLMVKLNYDTSALTLKSLTESGLSGTWNINGNIAGFMSVSDSMYNGTILTAVFSVSATAAPGSYPVTVTYNTEDIFNENFVDVNPTVVAGSVTVAQANPLTIKTQPVSVTAALDSTAKFTVAATGDGLTYQWQYKTATGTTWSNSGSTGCKTATLSVGATNARNGYSFRCVITDANGKSEISNAATLTVSSGAPVITKQPVSVTAALDSTAKFTVTATGTGLTYQWQYKTATGTTWSNSGSTGSKTATLSVGATNARNGFSFRCVIKDANGKSVYSNAAKLTVSGGAPVITKQPTSVSAALDSTAKFTVAATGTGLTYQWQYKTATGTTWSNSGSTGSKTATLSVGATNARNGFSFRCVIKDANGKSAISEAATLTVSGGAPVITKQPTSVSAALDSTAKFTVTATGTGLTYQWQYKTATGTTWSNSGSTGSKTATLSVGATNARNGFSFRCVIKDANGKSAISEAAKLTVSGGAPVITKQPTSVTAALDSTAKFTVTATGTGLTYQWQYKTATGTTWSNSGSTGSKTATLSVGATNARNGFSFRCVITDANGKSAVSNAVTLTVGSGSAPVITKQPVSVTAALDSTAKFTVAATGTGLTYQWQYKTATGTTWSNSGSTGNKTATLSVGATNARNGFSFRCVITDANGGSAVSNAVTLKVS